MADSKYRDLFDLNFRYFENLRNLSAKYEAKINVSMNCLSCSVAIWAITTTILFNTPLLPFFNYILTYIILSTALIIVAALGWIRGFSAIKFEEVNIFGLNSDVNRRFLDDEEERKKIYIDICKKLLNGNEDLDKNLENRMRSTKAVNNLSAIALAISIFLVGFVIIGKINENYYCNIKQEMSIAEYNNGNFDNIGAINDYCRFRK